MNVKRSLLSMMIALVLLASAGLVGAQDAAEPPALPSVEWLEPEYNAFTAQLPADWQVQSGLYDLFGTPGLTLVAVAPDNSAVIYSGLNGAYAFLEPNAALGLAAGGSLTLMGQEIPVAAVTPSDFLNGYLPYAYGEGAPCTDLTLDAVEALEAASPAMAAAQASVTCTYDGGTATGGFVVQLYAIEDAQFGRLWLAGELFGFLADSGSEALAEAAMVQFAQTLQEGPGYSAVASSLSGQPAVDMAAANNMDGSAMGFSSEMDMLAAQQMANQMQQMVNNHAVNMMTDQMNWFQQNQEMIMGIPTEYDTQYTYQWVWEQR